MPSFRLFAAACSLGLLAATSPARAESAPAGPQCGATTVPRADTRIPANAPALVVTPRNSAGVTSTLSLGSFSPPTGAFTLSPDPRSPGMLFVPTSDLPVAASATLQVNVRCSIAEPFELVTRFGIVPATALPTAAGTATARPVDPEYLNVVPVAFLPSAELVPFLPVTMLELSTNGKPLPWATVPYGDISLNREGSYTLRIPQYKGYTQTEDLCGPGDNAKKTLPFELRLHVAGATTDPPSISLTAEIDCGEVPPIPRPTTDAGVDDPGATNASNVESGCSAGPASPLTVSPFAAIGLSALVVGLRRARRRQLRVG